MNERREVEEGGGDRRQRREERTKRMNKEIGKEGKRQQASCIVHKPQTLFGVGVKTMCVCTDVDPREY